MTKNISSKELSTLFSRVKELNGIKSWQWLSYKDIIGIKYHDLENTYFCSFVGMYGIMIFKGVLGVETYFKILENDHKNKIELLHMQNCIAINLFDRKDMSKDDYALINKSGVKFRGRNNWPNFRKYEPGFLPRLLNDEELSLVNRILLDLKECVLYMKEHNECMGLIDRGEYFLREIEKDNIYKYSICELKKSLNDNYYKVPIIYDEVQIRRIKKQCKYTYNTWEMDNIYSITPVSEDGVQFFPAILITFDINNQRVVDSYVSHPSVIAQEFQSYLIEYFLENKKIPKKILICDTKLVMILGDLIKKLGIEIVLVNNLTYIPSIKEDIYANMIDFY